MFVPYLDYIQTEYDVIFLHCKNDMEYSRLQIKAIKCEISSTFHTYKLFRTLNNTNIIFMIIITRRTSQLPSISFRWLLYWCHMAYLKIGRQLYFLDCCIFLSKVHMWHNPMKHTISKNVDTIIYIWQKCFYAKNANSKFIVGSLSFSIKWHG